MRRRAAWLQAVRERWGERFTQSQSEGSQSVLSAQPMSAVRWTHDSGAKRKNAECLAADCQSDEGTVPVATMSSPGILISTRRRVALCACSSESKSATVEACNPGLSVLGVPSLGVVPLEFP